MVKGLSINCSILSTWSCGSCSVTNPALSLPYVPYAEGVSGGVAKEKEEDPYGGSTDEESDMETDIGECVHVWVRGGMTVLCKYCYSCCVGD